MPDFPCFLKRTVVGEGVTELSPVEFFYPANVDMPLVWPGTSLGSGKSARERKHKVWIFLTSRGGQIPNKYRIFSVLGAIKIEPSGASLR